MTILMKTTANAEIIPLTQSHASQRYPPIEPISPFRLGPLKQNINRSCKRQQLWMTKSQETHLAMTPQRKEKSSCSHNGMNQIFEIFWAEYPRYLENLTFAQEIQGACGSYEKKHNLTCMIILYAWRQSPGKRRLRPIWRSQTWKTLCVVLQVCKFVYKYTWCICAHMAYFPC